MGVIAIALIAVALAAVAAGPPQQIAFSSSSSDGSDIYLMTPDGSNAQRLTTTGLTAIQPGRRTDQIAFQHEDSGGTELWSANADGTNPHRHACQRPQWSRQGRIAFSDGDIYTISADGSGLTSDKGANANAPSWSADLPELAYERA